MALMAIMPPPTPPASPCSPPSHHSTSPAAAPNTATQPPPELVAMQHAKVGQAQRQLAVRAVAVAKHEAVACFQGRGSGRGGRRAHEGAWAGCDKLAEPPLGSSIGKCSGASRRAGGRVDCPILSPGGPHRGSSWASAQTRPSPPRKRTCFPCAAVVRGGRRHGRLGLSVAMRHLQA